MPTGSCLCTANKYTILDEAVAASKKVTCHCARCRKISGGFTTTNLVVPKSSFRMTSNVMKRRCLPRIFSDVSTFHSVVQGDLHGRLRFCRHCGSVLYRESLLEGFGGLIFIPVGTLDDVDSVKELREEQWY